MKKELHPIKYIGGTISVPGDKSIAHRAALFSIMAKGKIEILKSFTFFEVEEKSSDLVIQSFQNAEFKGRKLGIEKASPKKSSPKKDSKNMDRDKKRRTESFSNEERPKKDKDRKNRKNYSSHKK